MITDCANVALYWKKFIFSGRSGEFLGRYGIYAGPKTELLLENMLVYNDAVDTNIDLHLHHGHFVAFDLRWSIIAGICARHRMDDTLHWRFADTAMDADRNVEELEITVFTGIKEAKKKSSYITKCYEQVLHKIFYENLKIKWLNIRFVALFKMVRKAFIPASGWGPREVQQRKDWRIFKEEKARDQEKRIQPIWKQILYVLLNKEPI